MRPVRDGVRREYLQREETGQRPPLPAARAALDGPTAIPYINSQETKPRPR